ncbi:MAG: hypothetical protein IPP16_10295 [Acidimicrobiaceae bacterium]|nr:hypothetical protein [Acidimicrobiaceae bacterium]
MAQAPPHNRAPPTRLRRLLEGADGFYAGEGESVYHEANGNLYQTQASVDGDSRAASLSLLRVWLGL